MRAAGRRGRRGGPWLSKHVSALRLFGRRVQRPLAVAVQLALVIASNRVAFLLRFDGDVPPFGDEAFWQMLPWLVAVRAFVFVPFRLYEGVWRYTSLYDLRALVGGIGVSSGLFFLLTQTPLGPPIYPRSVFIVDAVLLMLLLGAVRMSKRLLAELRRRHPGKRVLIFGAGDAGELIVRDMKASASYGYYPIGFVDDDKSKVGLRIHGVLVVGTRAELPSILRRYRPEEVLLAIPHADPVAIRAVVRALEQFKVPIKTLPALRDMIDGKIALSEIRNLSVEDLLARAPVGLDPAPLKYLIGGRRVMVTGAGGSIGSELCRQITRLKPASLVMFERYENSLHAIRIELEDAHQRFGLHAVVGDVTDPIRVEEVMRQYEPEIVFHAAAHKHVPLMEENPCEAIKNNVRGTRLLAQAAEECGVDRFILISTDKAVNPTSVMGASKRVGGAARSRPFRRQRHVVLRRPLRQRARQQRQRGAAFSRSDQEGRPGHHHPSRDSPLLHADSGSRSARAARGGAGRRRRHLRAGDGRAGEAARHGAGSHSIVGFRARIGHRHRVRGPAAGRETLRGAGRGRRGGRRRRRSKRSCG